MKDKKGLAIASKTVTIAVSILVLFTLMAAFYPQMVSAGNSLNSSGITFGSFFAKGGVTWTLVAVGLLVAVIGLVSYKKH